ncbi:hypothetical protein ACS3QZ_07945 [Shimia sp. W99]
MTVPFSGTRAATDMRDPGLWPVWGKCLCTRNHDLTNIMGKGATVRAARSQKHRETGQHDAGRTDTEGMT